MQYDFTSILPRNGRDAIAVDGLGGMPGFTPGAPREGFDAIPMWVADMNFPTVPTIQKAMADRIQHPASAISPPVRSISPPSSAGSKSATGSPALPRKTSATKTACWAALCRL